VKTLLLLAGIGQLALAAFSLLIPAVLDWRRETLRLSRLTRQVFWTYAGYIWAFNVCFGVISLTSADALLSGAELVRPLCGFIAAYWGVRLLLQLVWFDNSQAPPGLRYKLADAGLVGLFAGLSLTYGAIAWQAS
jgi:hypothetical protein